MGEVIITVGLFVFCLAVLFGKVDLTFDDPYARDRKRK